MMMICPGKEGVFMGFGGTTYFNTNSYGSFLMLEERHERLCNGMLKPKELKQHEIVALQWIYKHRSEFEAAHLPDEQWQEESPENWNAVGLIADLWGKQIKFEAYSFLLPKPFTFYEMLQTENFSKITVFDLQSLEMKHLEAFSRLLGIHWSGDKEKRIERLYSAIRMRLKLAQVKEPDELVKNHKRTELSELAKSVGVIHYVSKYAIAVSLLNWRNKCRQNGQKFKMEMTEEIRNNPQKRLF